MKGTNRRQMTHYEPFPLSKYCVLPNLVKYLRRLWSTARPTLVRDYGPSSSIFRPTIATPNCVPASFNQGTLSASVFPDCFSK
ncbi:hypothetical protein Mapa_000503 [Marchantia paleacea]|nr:hypothetical protein Mapa_000503 [Marchantia paleacea]